MTKYVILPKIKTQTAIFPNAAVLAGGHGVAPSYVDLESTRSAIDPPPAICKLDKPEKNK
jgi:hypothetical protein